MRFDQRNQAFPGHDLIHFNQETLAARLLTFARVLGLTHPCKITLASSCFSNKKFVTHPAVQLPKWPLALT